MSTDMYIQIARKPTDEEIDFISKRFIHNAEEMNLLPFDPDEDKESIQNLEQANLIRYATTFTESTDSELLKKEYNVPEDAQPSGLAIRPTYMEWEWKTSDGTTYHAVVTDWNMDHRYTIIGTFKYALTKRIDVRDCNNDKKLHNIAKKYLKIHNTRYEIIPPAMLEELLEKGYIDSLIPIVDETESPDEWCYIYHEWW